MNGVVTVCDAAHGHGMLDRGFESVVRVTVANVPVLAKTDLVTPSQAARFRARPTALAPLGGTVLSSGPICGLPVGQVRIAKAASSSSAATSPRTCCRNALTCQGHGPGRHAQPVTQQAGLPSVPPQRLPQATVSPALIFASQTVPGRHRVMAGCDRETGFSAESGPGAMRTS